MQNRKPCKQVKIFLSFQGHTLEEQEDQLGAVQPPTQVPTQEMGMAIVTNRQLLSNIICSDA
jgi:hypothetical protein